MNFDSNSALLNGGKPFKIQLKFPAGLKGLILPEEVIDDAIKEYNVHLNKRAKVSKYVNGMKVDFLAIAKEGDDLPYFILWAAALPTVIASVTNTDFTIKGDVYFADNSDIKVEKWS
jgi:hypothetical protein